VVLLAVSPEGGRGLCSLRHDPSLFVYLERRNPSIVRVPIVDGRAGAVGFGFGGGGGRRNVWMDGWMASQVRTPLGIYIYIYFFTRGVILERLGWNFLGFFDSGTLIEKRTERPLDLLNDAWLLLRRTLSGSPQE